MFCNKFVSATNAKNKLLKEFGSIQLYQDGFQWRSYMYGTECEIEFNPFKNKQLLKFNLRAHKRVYHQRTYCNELHIWLSDECRTSCAA